MIEDIATEVSNKLNLYAPCNDFVDLVETKSNMKEMRPLLQLDSNEVRKVGIWGPPGIGKTTIARSLFNQHSQDFQLSVFMDNIKRKYAIPDCSDDYSVKLDLQKQLMSQLTNETCTSIAHLGVVKDRLKDKKVLVVLDDVDHLVQVEAMAKETYWFGPGSRIIITTQDQRVLKASGVDHIHKVNLPSNDEALQMFCMYAFDQKYPKYGFKELAWKVINLVGRLPLGLKVMGSYFRGMSEQDWTEALPRLKAHLDRNGDIANILKFSYDSLNDEDKSLFLHIACFFDGEPVDTVENCLEKCFVDVRQGLRFLSAKSLVSTDHDIIHMGKLLVQLGRQIVRKESVRKPGERQFLNDASDIGEVLSDDKAGNSSLIGIYLNRKDKITWTSERAFERLSNLRFLKVHGFGINPQSMNYISQKLRILIWAKFRMSCFPSSFNPEFLVELCMVKGSFEKLWDGIKPLHNLRLMDLSNSKRLRELPDLSTATNLYKLNLSHCSRLVKLSIGNAINLQCLNVSYCSRLVKVSSSIGNAINLKNLYLTHCSSLVKLPSSMRNLGRLSHLVLWKCSKLEVNLANINLESLEKLDLSGCSLLKSYPESSTDIQEIDPWIGRTSRLRRLHISGMKNLVSLPPLPDSVVELDAESGSLERLDCTFRNPDICLNFRNCFKLNKEARDLISLTRTNGYAIFPADEVPQCFTYRSSGSSVTVKLNQLPVGKSTKFKACFILADEDRVYPGYVCCSITSGGNFLTYCRKNILSVLPGHLYTFEVEFETEELSSTVLVFDFDVRYRDRESYFYKKGR